METFEQLQVSLLLSGDEATFEKVYKQYLRPLHVYAINMLRDEEIAQGMVQNVFLKLWERRECIVITSSLQAYLYTALYHECLNYLRHQKVKVNHQQYVMDRQNNQYSTGMELMDFKEKLRNALNELPEGCRNIFQLSRFEELKYQEIADRLQISIKTVEAQMGKALRLLRIKLTDYLPLIVWLILK